MKKKREFCESIKDNQNLYISCMDQYYYTKAIDRLDVKSCDNIIDKKLKQKCKEEVSVVCAMEYTDISKCKNLENEKNGKRVRR